MLAYMLRVMNDPGTEPERRDRMAIAAAPFMHPRATDVAKGKKELEAESANRPEAARLRPLGLQLLYLPFSHVGWDAQAG